MFICQEQVLRAGDLEIAETDFKSILGSYPELECATDGLIDIAESKCKIAQKKSRNRKL